MNFTSPETWRRWLRDRQQAGARTVADLAPDTLDQALARLSDPAVIDALFNELEARTQGAGRMDDAPRCRCGGAHDEDDCSYASVRGRPW